MKQILQDLSTGETSLIESPSPILASKSLKISTNVSLISAGTERMLVNFGKSSYIEKARQQPEKVRMVFDKAITDGVVATYDSVKSKLSQPIPLGYSNVGVVQEVSDGISEFKVGDRVVSNGAHADIVTVKKNLCARIPDNVDDDSAVFTIIGSIGLQGVRLAKPALGEAFVVIGAGLIGLITIQLLKANGCKVLAVDLDQSKLDLAAQFGAEICNPGDGGNVISHSSTFSHGRGVDGVIITASTQSNEPMKQAAQICRVRGRVILVGVVGLNLDRADFYEKEISFQVSCSYGPGRYDTSYEEDGNDYPFGFVRWTEQRNFEAFLDLLSSGALNVKPLITSRFVFNDAPKAYAELTDNAAGLGILLDYESEIKQRLITRVSLADDHSFLSQKPSLAFLGAGNYASRILIPAFKKAGAQLHTLVSANGINSVIHGKKAGFLLSSTSAEDTINDPQNNTIVIATRHNSHSKFTAQALDANKNVWTEKPLAIDSDGLSVIKSAFEKARKRNKGHSSCPQLMVGFNRRFAPHIQKMKTLLSSEKDAKTIIITVNAGLIPDDHWTQDPKIGGERIIGEGCHFIDLARYLVGQPISSINGRSMMSNGEGSVILDRSSITLGFNDGSLGTILYLANGSADYPKERVEVFVGGKVLQLDNYRKLKGFGWRGFKKMNLFSQNKGQSACALAFIESIETGVPCIPVNEIFEVAEATLEANNILLKNL